MNVLITGTSGGIGRAAAIRFLEAGHRVTGIDKRTGSIEHAHYTHKVFDLRSCEPLPEVGEVHILVNNAGVQNEGDDIEVNLSALMRVTEHYGVQEHIRSICNIASASAHNGAEFPAYAASKGGVLAYTKNVAMRVAAYGATCNSISPGGVLTELNRHVIEDQALWTQIMDETPLKKWASAEEIAEWIYFLTVVNRSMTAQDVLIDNGEMAQFHFVW